MIIATRLGKKYLKTTADGEQPDNLLSLPLTRALELLDKARGYGLADLASDVVLPTERLEPFRLTLEAPMAPELTLP